MASISYNVVWELGVSLGKSNNLMWVKEMDNRRNMWEEDGYI